MKFLNILSWVITLVLGIVAFMYYSKSDEYENQNGYRDVTGVICEKLGTGETQYRSSIVTISYVLIVKDDITGKYIDFKVNPTTYATHNVGDRITFYNVSKEKIGEEYEKNPYILSCIMFGIGCVFMFFYSQFRSSYYK